MSDADAMAAWAKFNGEERWRQGEVAKILRANFDDVVWDGTYDHVARQIVIALRTKAPLLSEEETMSERDRIEHQLEHMWRKLRRMEYTLRDILAKVNRTLGLELTDLRRSEEMKDQLAKIEKEVSENSDAVDSAVTLLTGLAAEIRDAAGDEEAIEALATKLDQNSARLAQAVVDNTPFQRSGS